jgi:hypothetical protein
VFSFTCVVTTVSQILTGTGEGNLFVWDGGQSLHARHLVQFEEAHDLAVLALQFAPVTAGKKLIKGLFARKSDFALSLTVY